MELNEQTKKAIREWVQAHGGDVEKTAKWMARSFRTIGGVGFFRKAIQEAMA